MFVGLGAKTLSTRWSGSTNTVTLSLLSIFPLFEGTTRGGWSPGMPHQETFLTDKSHLAGFLDMNFQLHDPYS